MSHNEEMPAAWPRPLVLVGGCGAVGSWIVRWLQPLTALLCADRDVVSMENIGVAALEAADAPAVLGRRKAEVVAERHRARGGWAHALYGDVRYTLTPGLIERLDAAFLCFDNPGAFRDASEVLWASARAGIPILAATCGGDDDERWQVRVFETGGLCPACMASAAERQETAALPGASCTALDAPRASGVAAEAAGRAGADLFARVIGGERRLVGCRIQRDGRATPDWTVRMPATPVPGCPIPHGNRGLRRIEDLGGGIDDITVGGLAERARDIAGGDATFVLGRRSMPLAGFVCPACQHRSEAPPLLLPAAAAEARACDCSGALRPLGERRTISARELLASPARDGSLRAWGAAPGDGFLVVGDRATAELRCRLTVEELSRD